jgi:hypothetical protein
MEYQTIHVAGNAKNIQQRHPRPRSGIAQLSLVEHALCALDPALSLVGGYEHQTGYFYTDANRRHFAHVSVSAPLGLSSRDEYFLWGLLALTFNQPEPSIEFLATPHYCLKQLGYLEAKGGKQYAEFRATIKRLAGVFYQCDAFYDPRLQSFQDTGFGFLKYSLPQHDDSSRAWRIVWDPLFFEYVQSTGGKLFFDLTSRAFRDLDPASRRLALLLHKIFWRHKQSPPFELRHLGVNVLGFSPQRLTKYLKRDIGRCAERLLAAGFITLPPGVDRVSRLFETTGKGQFKIRFHRGLYFEQHSVDQLASRLVTSIVDSPLYDPLKAIGFEDVAIRSIVKKYDHQVVARWAQYTQVAIESKGTRFFKKSPQAYCLDGIKRGTSAPDWFLEHQRDERRQQHDADLQARGAFADEPELTAAYRKARSEALRKFLHEEIDRERYQSTVNTFLTVFKDAPSDVAREQAIAEAERHLESGFRFPDYADWSSGNILERFADTYTE